MRRRLPAHWALGLALALGPAAAQAIVCSVDSVVPVSFGAYDPFDPSPTDGTGSITYTCSGAVAEDSISLAISAGQSGTYSPRALTAGATGLPYTACLDASRTSPWGDGTQGTSTYTASGTGLNGTHVITVYGRIAAGANPVPGSYSDTLTVTLTY